MDSKGRIWAEPARAALIVVTVCLLLGASMVGNRGGRSMAQEGEVTPATPEAAGTPVAIDF